MKRTLMALALLLVGATTPAWADYLVLLIHLGGDHKSGGKGGGPGRPGGFGLLGRPGGGPGMGGFPAGGGAAGFPAGGGAAGMGGFPGGAAGRPDGAAGMAGFPAGGAAGAGGFPAGGAAGAAGFGGRPGGAGGGPPFGGGAGAAGGPPGAFMGGGATGMGGTKSPETIDAEDDRNLVVAVIEFDPLTAGPYVKKFEADHPIRIRHRWGGEVTIYKETTSARAFMLKQPGGKPWPSLHRQYEELRGKAMAPTAEPPDVLKTAEWCLHHGLVKEFAETMERAAELDKNLPSVLAYVKVRDQLKKPAEPAKVPPAYAKLLEGYRPMEKPGHHYTLLYNTKGGAQPTEAEHVLDQLENHFKGFYYWWAFKNTPLPLPTARQIVVMPDDDRDFDRYHALLTSGPVIADAFYARREGLTVMAKHRLDDTFDALDKYFGRFTNSGFDPEALLRGKGGVPRDFRDPSAQSYVNDARMIVLVHKALIVQRELNAVSHDATRQFLYGSGLLPRNVIAPEWLLFGMASFFETPMESPWPSIGAPSFQWLPEFKTAKQTRFEKSDLQTLRQVVTDSYFRSVPPHGASRESEKAHERALRRARATAWGLAYFLANEKREGLIRYFKEISKMPRDIELSEEALWGCFVRAFGTNLEGLASTWVRYVDNTTLEAEEFRKNIKEATISLLREELLKKDDDKKGGPGGPGGGGGRGPGGT